MDAAPATALDVLLEVRVLRFWSAPIHRRWGIFRVGTNYSPSHVSCNDAEKMRCREEHYRSDCTCPGSFSSSNAGLAAAELVFSMAYLEFLNDWQGRVDGQATARLRYRYRDAGAPKRCPAPVALASQRSLSVRSWVGKEIYNYAN